MEILHKVNVSRFIVSSHIILSSFQRTKQLTSITSCDASVQMHHAALRRGEDKLPRVYYAAGAHILRATTHKVRKFNLSKLNETNAFILKCPTDTFIFLRKEVIQPHLPLRLPCYRSESTRLNSSH